MGVQGQHKLSGFHVTVVMRGPDDFLLRFDNLQAYQFFQSALTTFNDRLAYQEVSGAMFNKPVTYVWDLRKLSLTWSGSLLSLAQLLSSQKFSRCPLTQPEAAALGRALLPMRSAAVGCRRSSHGSGSTITPPSTPSPRA